MKTPNKQQKMPPQKPTTDPRPRAPVPKGLPSVADSTPAPGHPNGPDGGTIRPPDNAAGEGGNWD